MRPHRLSGFEYLGVHAYLVTCCTLDRHQAFVEDRLALPVREEILRTCHECEFEETALVLMPDHIHLLTVGLSDGSDFRPFMKLLRQRAAIAYRQRCGRKLWQDGFHERVLRAEEDLRGTAAYIIANPVRKGLAGRPSEYPYVWCKYGLEIA
jgi:REP-associated tyrosine transposase